MACYARKKLACLKHLIFPRCLFFLDPDPQQFLNFSPLPHGHGSFLPTFLFTREYTHCGGELRPADQKRTVTLCGIAAHFSRHAAGTLVSPSNRLSSVAFENGCF